MMTNKKLIALNLCLLLIFSAVSLSIGAISAPTYSITVDGTTFTSTADSSGEGWQYYSAENKLVLDGYSGSTIKASGDLVIYVEDDSEISGTTSDVYSASSCGILVTGTLELNASADLTVNGANTSSAKGGEGIVALNAILNSDYGAELVINGGKGACAIKANDLTLATKKLTANGGTDASAIFFSSSMIIKAKTSGVIKSGSTKKAAITYLSGASYNDFDDDVELKFYDKNSRIVLTSKSAVYYGDVDQDGDIGPADLVLLAQKIAGWDVELSSKGYLAADVDSDGDLRIEDLVLLAQYIAGWNVSIGPN